MTLMQWADNGWLTSHKTSTQEIGNLLAIVERDLKDAIEGRISAANYLWTHAAPKETSLSMIISEALQKTMRMSLLTL